MRGSPDIFSDVSFDRIVGILNGKRGCHNYVDLMAVGKLVKREQQTLKSIAIVVADAESGVDEHVGHVVVAGKYARHKAVKGSCVKDIVLINVDKSASVIYIVAELYTLFDAHDRAFARLDRLVDHFDKSFGLAGAFDSDE